MMSKSNSHEVLTINIPRVNTHTPHNCRNSEIVRYSTKQGKSSKACHSAKNIKSSDKRTVTPSKMLVKLAKRNSQSQNKALKKLKEQLVQSMGKKHKRKVSKKRASRSRSAHCKRNSINWKVQ